MILLIFTVQTAALLCTLYVVVSLLYRVFWHPLSRIPGPLVVRCTSLWLYYHSWAGDEASQIQRLHRKYGAVVRIGPNEVDIDDGAALAAVYSSKGGFRKADCYMNFDIEGHHSIFSTVDPEHRRSRVKAVISIFSTSAIYSDAHKLRSIADAFVRRLRKDAASKKPINILNLARCLAVDGVTSYLFGQNYGAMEEQGGRMSASMFVDAFVAVGRFFYMPRKVFICLEVLISKLVPNPEANESMASVDKFVSSLVDAASNKDNTYQARLLAAGFSKAEARIQCEDLMFAGTDSTGGTLATICWYLAGDTKVYENLRREVLTNEVPEDRLQMLPYLRAVIQEGLRLSFPNPGRLPRVVPADGWNFKGLHLPAGTIVGLGSWQLHLKESVFSNAHLFDPDRWLDPTTEMQRDYIPFGIGSRQCIARNFALAEIYITLESLVRSDVLRGATRVQGKIEILQWFNSKVMNERVDLIWT